MNAQILTVGNELLIGDIVNTNASWIGQVFTREGIKIGKVVSVGDKEQDIIDAVKQGLEQADIVLMTGGLGPTHDDITKKALQNFYGCGLRTDEQVLEYVRSIFERRGLPFSKSNVGQAEVLDNCEVMFNKKGTAPGMWIDDERGMVAVMPGVPYEMKYLIANEVLPRLEKKGHKRQAYAVRYFKCLGIGESTLSDNHLPDVTSFLNDDVGLAFLPQRDGLNLRLSAFADSSDQAEALLDPASAYIREHAAEFIYSENPDATIAEAVGTLLTEAGSTVSFAESCTGGLVSDMMTNIPGSSAYLMGSAVVYSNEAKVNLLGVNQETIEKHGAVSKNCVFEMAKGVAKLFGTDYGMAVSGIAGPGGGTEEKPVGTVWFGFWSKSAHFAFMLRLTNDRLVNKRRSAQIVLDTLRRQLSGIEYLPYRVAPQTA